MADSIQLSVNLNDGGALATLRDLDSIAKRLSGKTIKFKVDASTIKQAKDSATALATALQKASTQMLAFKNGSASGLKGSTTELRAAAEQMQQAASALQQAKGSLSGSGGGTGGSGGSGFLGIAGSMLKYQAITFAINKVTESFSYAFEEMKNVDTEMVNIAKVTRMSQGELAKLEKAAYSLGTQYGRTGSEVLEAQTVFARAGYTDQIAQLAELSLLLQNAGDLQADDAAKFIIATDAAYKLGGSYEELMKVIDGLDNITNKNATDMQKMTDGMTIAGSVFAESGESVQTFAALLGAGTALTQRSGSEIARGLRTILMNLRQIKGETEDGELIDGESIANAAKALKEYAGISTMENGQLRKASDVLEDLAEKWDTLDETQRAAISEAVAGKRQANVLMAIMGNWDMVTKMEEEYANAAGTAAMENAAYMESWAAKIEVVKASWTELIQNIVGSDIFKNFLGAIADILDRINNAIHPDQAAQETVSTLEQEYATLYGQDGEYEQLLSRANELTDVEKRRLQYLKDQKPIMEQQIRDAKQAAFDAWQQQHGSQAYVTQVVGQTEFGENIEQTISKDLYDLQQVSKALEEINSQFADTADITAYNNGISQLRAKYGTLREELQSWKDQGFTLTDEQTQLLNVLATLDDLTMTTENDTAAYAASLSAYFMTLGADAQTAYINAIKVAKGIDDITDAVNGIPDKKTVEVDVSTNISGGLNSILAGVPHNASGTKNSPGGLSLVNEQGPEIISANGLAWIAGGGEPTITMLPKGATVLTASETRSALNGIPAYEDGTDDNGLSIEEVKKLLGSAYGGDSSGSRESSFKETSVVQREYLYKEVGKKTRKKGKGNNSTGYWEESSGGPVKPNFKALEQDLSDVLKNLDLQAQLAENQEDYLKAMEVYGDAQNEIAKLIEEYRAAGYADDSNEILTLANKGYSYANKQFKAYDALRDRLIDALEALTEATEDANELAEKREAVEKAREALENAKKQRNVRIFNPITGQWEWVANAEDVAKAEESLKNAEQALQKEEISQTVKALENAKGDDLSNLVLSPAILEKFANGTPEQQAAFISALNGATGGADYMGSTEAQTAFNQGNTVNIGEQYNLAGITLTDQMANGMTIAQLLDYLQGLRIM